MWSSTVRDSTDFAEFYGASFDGLCVQLYAHAGSWSEAQDVVQEAFCRALARWSRISQYDDPAAWVRKVAWNLATSRWRRVRSNLHFVHRERPEHAPGPDAEFIDLRTALTALPPKQRQAVVLHYLSDVPVLEIAEMMGVAEGTVKSWLHRARTTLDGRLKLVEAPKIPRPGPEAARRTVRRRRDRNTVAGVAVLTCLAIAAMLLPSRLLKEPIVESTPSPSPAVSAEPAPSASAEAQASAPPSPTAGGGPACIPYPIAQALNNLPADNARVSFMDPNLNTPDPRQSMCPGVQLRISWVSYTLDGVGNLTLAYSGQVVLDNTNRQRTFQVRLPAVPQRCYVYFVTATNVPVPQYMEKSWLYTKGPGSPFWDDRTKQRSLIREEPVGFCPPPSPTLSP